MTSAVQSAVDNYLAESFRQIRFPEQEAKILFLVKLAKSALDLADVLSDSTDEEVVA